MQMKQTYGILHSNRNNVPLLDSCLPNLHPVKPTIARLADASKHHLTPKPLGRLLLGWDTVFIVVLEVSDEVLDSSFAGLELVFRDEIKILCQVSTSIGIRWETQTYSLETMLILLKHAFWRPEPIPLSLRRTLASKRHTWQRFQKYGIQEMVTPRNFPFLARASL